MRQKLSDLSAKLRRIQLLVSDVDGTLTDGALYYSANGEALKAFHVHDGLGIVLVQRAGIRVVFVSQEDSPIAAARARKLGVFRCLLSVQDKAAAVQTLADELAIDLEQIAYIGDDLTDLPAMSRVGVSACPADAVREVWQQVDYVCSAPGGKGAVREFCELLLRSRSLEPEELLHGFHVSQA
jgi:YrbI family 3-deoxy-D-manno-octulosonate 8-phosphate phosphatase